MVEDYQSKTLKPFDFNEVNKELPELKKIKCQIDAVSFKNPIDSSNVSPQIWEKIGDYIFKNYENYDGFKNFKEIDQKKTFIKKVPLNNLKIKFLYY